MKLVNFFENSKPGSGFQEPSESGCLGKQIKKGKAKKKSESVDESFQYYDVRHKPSGKVYKRIAALSQASAKTKAAVQHGGRSASAYSGTSDDQFEIVENFNKKSGNALKAHGLEAYKYTQGGKDYYISVQNGKETGQFDSLQDLKIHQTSLINGEIDSYVDNRNMGHPDGVSTMEGTLTEEQFDEAAGEKDACYHKVKSRYDVWPSAYASGALVKCRKVGASNWGNSKKK